MGTAARANSSCANHHRQLERTRAKPSCASRHRQQKCTRCIALSVRIATPLAACCVAPCGLDLSRVTAHWHSYKLHPQTRVVPEIPQYESLNNRGASQIYSIQTVHRGFHCTTGWIRYSAVLFYCHHTIAHTRSWPSNPPLVVLSSHACSTVAYSTVADGFPGLVVCNI